MRKIMINGHRPKLFGGYDAADPWNLRIRHVLDILMLMLKAKYRDNIQIITGGALGIDQWAIESAIMMHVNCTIAVPFAGYTKAWPEESQKHFKYLCGLVNNVHYISDEKEYDVKFLFQRDEWMLANADCIISFCLQDQDRSGTMNALRKARKAGIPIIIVDPLALRDGNYNDVLHFYPGSDNNLNNELRGVTIHNIPK